MRPAAAVRVAQIDEQYREASMKLRKEVGLVKTLENELHEETLKDQDHMHALQTANNYTKVLEDKLQRTAESEAKANSELDAAGKRLQMLREQARLAGGDCMCRHSRRTPRGGGMEEGTREAGSEGATAEEMWDATGPPLCVQQLLAPPPLTAILRACVCSCADCVRRSSSS